MIPLTSSVETESSRVRAIADERVMAGYESTVTLDFYPFKVCSGIGYWNVGTHGALAGREGG
jgi:hypothetical protein